MSQFGNNLATIMQVRDKSKIIILNVSAAHKGYDPSGSVPNDVNNHFGILLGSIVTYVCG